MFKKTAKILIFHFIAVAAIHSTSAIGFAAAPFIETRTFNYSPKPTQAVVEKWMKNFFETEDHFFFKDYDDFDLFMAGTGLAQPVQNEVRSHFTIGISRELGSQGLNYHGAKPYRENRGFLIIPQTLWFGLPASFISALYEHQTHERRIPLRFFFEKGSRAKLEGFLKSEVTSSWSYEILKKNIISLAGSSYLVVNASVWPLFSEKMKLEVIADTIKPEDLTRGKQIYVKLTETNLESIARRYAAESDFDRALVFLQLLRRANGEESVWVDTRDLRHEYIKKMLDVYTSCHNVDCLRTAMTLNLGEDHMEAKLPNTILRLHDIYLRYRFVAENEPLKVGDLLYYQKDGAFVHASSYVGEGNVFTKNGSSKFNPRLIQTKRENEKVYFKDGKFQLIVFRLPESGESVIAANGTYDGPLPFYQINAGGKTCPSQLEDL